MVMEICKRKNFFVIMISMRMTWNFDEILHYKLFSLPLFSNTINLTEF